MKKKKKAPGPVLVVFGLLFCGAAGFFIVTLIDDIIRQAHLVAVAQVVPATVVTADIERMHAKKGVRFKPVITYRYDIAGKSYQNDRHFPVVRPPAFKYQADAVLVSRSFPVGGQITAYYDPLHPQDSFLIRRIDFEPYSGIMFVMIHFSAGLLMVMFQIVRSKTALGDVRRWGIALAVWTMVGTLALIHYATVGGEWDYFSGGFAAGFIVITLLLAWWWSRVGAKAMNEASATDGRVVPSAASEQ